MGQGRSRDYEGLDPAQLEALRAPPPPHQYAGLVHRSTPPQDIQGPDPRVHSATEELDQHGYLQVFGDSDDEQQTEVDICIY